MEKETLELLFKVAGTTQTTRKGMECALQWILDEALKDEISRNWEDAIIKNRETYIEKHANVISSHVVYHIKLEENDEKRMKARI